MKYICDKEDELFNYLKINISNKSKNNIKSLLKNECILVNNNIVTKYNYIVKTGDIIEVNKSKKINSELDIIYEDDNIIVVNKPSKLLTISNKKKKVFVIHRLDYDTSGVIMFAKNKEVQKLYQSKWNELAKIREYTAVVEGITDNKGHIESYLKQTKTLLVYSSKSKDGYFAVTDYERIMYNNKYSMLKIHISTGRRNQIRCHMHDIKHPILGDSRYDSKYNPLGRLALHANKLVITNPISKKELTFVSKIPLEFYNLVK